VRRAVINLRIVIVRLAFRLARRLPIRQHVVLATAHGERISGNLAFIRDELARRDPAVPLVIVAHRPGKGVLGRVVGLLHGLQAGYHLATARVTVVDDYFFPMYVIEPRPGTTFVQVWHASGAFKKFGYSVLEKSFGADEAYVSMVKIHINYDVCLVSSMNVAPFYAEAFDQPLDRFTSRTGIPRTDVLFGDTALERAAAVRSRYGLSDDRTVILYAPTFRGESVTSATYDDYLDLELMARMLAADHVVLMRLHPFVRSALRIPEELAGFAFDVSDHPDINELMLVSDLLVTDYSSAIYEFSLLGRPICFLAPDHQAYEGERGFYFDYMSGVPGPVFETTEGLARYIQARRFDTVRVAAFREANFDVADGHASERFVDQILLPALRRAEGTPDRRRLD
jgi:CDP-ribitol ribitolphosphotransferase